MKTAAIQFLAAILLALLAASVSAADAPIAGLAPDARPADAPRLAAYPKDAAWYQHALTGVSQSYPHSLRFLEDQGAWHTPFTVPGMTGPYDLRNWHLPAPAVGDQGVARR